MIHRFKNKELFKEAMTHSSVPGSKNLERLEFLGDKVLGLLSASLLMHRYPTLSEGEMTKKHTALVRAETCAKAAVYFGLDKELILSDTEERAGGRKKERILADLCEAYLGAVFLDGGFEVAGKVFAFYWGARLKELTSYEGDAKTRLQEWSQSQKFGVPKYTLISKTGYDHAPLFTVDVRVASFVSVGVGASLKAAEEGAAKGMLYQIARAELLHLSENLPSE